MKTITLKNKHETVQVAMGDDSRPAGVMGPIGNRTVVYKTVCGRFAIFTAKQPYRLIKVINEEWPARCYNAAIHGEKLY